MGIRSPNWFGGIKSRPFGARGIAARAALPGSKGGFSFAKENPPFKSPKRKVLTLQASSSKSCDACRLHFPARGIAAFSVAIRFDLLLLSAVAQPLAALTPYGCGTPLAGAALPVLWQCGLITVYRCTHQCGERSKAAFGTQSAAVLPSLAPHDSKARLQDVTICRRFMAKPCTPHPHCAACAVIRAANCQCRGTRGSPLVLSLGGVRGIFSF